MSFLFEFRARAEAWCADTPADGGPAACFGIISGELLRPALRLAATGRLPEGDLPLDLLFAIQKRGMAKALLRRNGRITNFPEFSWPLILLKACTVVPLDTTLQAHRGVAAVAASGPAGCIVHAHVFCSVSGSSGCLAQLSLWGGGWTRPCSHTNDSKSSSFPKEHVSNEEGNKQRMRAVWPGSLGSMSAHTMAVWMAPASVDISLVSADVRATCVDLQNLRTCLQNRWPGVLRCAVEAAHL